MGLEKKVQLLRAEGKTYEGIARILTEEHPKKSGKKWIGPTIEQYFKSKRQRVQDMASMDDSLVKEATKEVIDTVNTLHKINKLLNDWVDKADTEKVKTFACQGCGEPNNVTVFDSDKAVRIAHEMLLMLKTAKELTGKVPVAQATQTSAIDIKRLIDKMVADGVLIVANPEKLHSFGTNQP
jgi:5-methylcytosine-specific restriction endonuclease McrBC regulatory subunit McrC